VKENRAETALLRGLILSFDFDFYPLLGCRALEVWAGIARCMSELVWHFDSRVHFRDPQMTQDKAQSAVNGYSLNKDCNAGLGLLWASLWAQRVVIIYGVASLGKDTAIPCETCLVANGYSMR